jgi:KRAB domain-containing zinc finger protein
LKHKDKVTCPECGIKLGKYVLARHMKIKHSNLPPEFQCQEPGCNYATHEKITLKMHTEKVHENIRWPCDSCDYVGGYKADLNRHKKTVHEGFILQCPNCEYSTSKKYSLKEHLSKQHGVIQESS